jgi:hypothetical protein
VLNNKALLLVTATVRSELRWAREHVYSWLVLGPLVLGITYATLSRFSNNLPDWRPSPVTTVAVAVAVELCLITLGLSRASAEIYHIRRPEALFESLPLRPATHLRAALIVRLARTVVAAAVVLAIWLIVTRASRAAFDVLLPLAIFAAITALAETFAALNWIHWSHRREKWAAMAAVAFLVVTAALAGLALALAFKPGSLGSTQPWIMASGVVWVVVLYSVAHLLHERWRAGDVEYARRLQLSARWNVFGLRVFQKRLGAVVAAQLARDLHLTLRAFSSAVYVAAAFAVLSLVGLVVVLTTDVLPAAEGEPSLLDATWLPQVLATKIACVLMTTSFAALLPVLISYELPHLWLERAVGTTGLDIWQAKLWYTRIVSGACPAAAWLAGMLTGQLPLTYSLPLLIECLWLWWMVSSLAGSLGFEIPTRTGLAIIVIVTMALSIGMLSAFLWPLGLMMYGYSMPSLVKRGRVRTRYFLITGDD